MKNCFLVFALGLLCLMTNATKLTANSSQVCGDGHTNTATSFESLKTVAHISLVATPITRDATFVNKKFGLWGFFAGAIKSLVVWAGYKLFNHVVNNANTRASYLDSYYQQSDPGTTQLANHLDEQVYNNYHCGNPPNHKNNREGIENCGMCRNEVNLVTR